MSNATLIKAKELPGNLIDALRDFCDAFGTYLSETARTAENIEPAVMNLYFESLFFIEIYEGLDDKYALLLRLEGKSFLVQLMCLDPSGKLAQVQKKAVSSIFFSATLTPLNYFIDVLGGKKDANRAALPSAFDPHNLLVLVDDGISTTFKERDKSLLPVARALTEMVNGHQGNYFAFFPSYDYMEKVFSVFTQLAPHVKAVIQSRNATAIENESFLEAFQSDSKGTFLAFAVLGGSFSEGIDLVGDRLIGAAVVGVGLPQICAERDFMRDYYDNSIGQGFEFAYMYPGMNRVLQACGRVIRSSKDRGVVLLIDRRYKNSDYRALLPDYWRKYNGTGDIRAILERFWEQGI